MGGETEIGVVVQGFEKGLVAAAVGIRYYFWKIADRLVGMDAKEKGDSLSHQGKFQVARRIVPPLSGVPPPRLIG